MADLNTAIDRMETHAEWEERKVVSLRAVTSPLLFPFYDFLSIAAMPQLSGILVKTPENVEKNTAFWLLMAVLSVLLIASYGGYLYNQKKKFQGQAVLAIKSYLATSLAMLTVAVLMGHTHSVYQPETLADLICSSGLLALTRLGSEKSEAAAHAARQSGSIIICYNHCGQSLGKALEQHGISRQIAGVLYLMPDQHTPADPLDRKINGIQNLLNIIQTENIQDVIFIHHSKLDSVSPASRQEVLLELMSFPTRIWLAFDVGHEIPELIRNRSGNYKLVPLLTDHLVSSENFTKRSFDLLVGTALFCLSLPVLVLLAILVRSSGPGPVIFKQLRTGAHGNQFYVLKFRTMIYNPAARFEQASLNDPRVTRIGRLLRKSSLDELLQLINVIKGDMSLVGPRPHAPETRVEGLSFDQAVKFYRLRHRVKPGLTGLAQIRGQRGETKAITALEQRLASDLEYIDSWSIWKDIAILIQTIPVLFRQNNAY